ncbi:MAG TPA: lytic transglycosylase domain-containing protein [Stellaceae bacterium]|nr:lytic transglycosylase domain-containing protein [Stellaceae bacterium]
MRSLARFVVLLALLALPLRLAGAAALSQADREVYRQAFESVRAGDWAGAYAKAQQAQDPFLNKAIRFLDMSRQGSGWSFGDIMAFVAGNPDWPSERLLRERAEEAITNASDDEVGRWFARFPPVTALGRLREADYLLAHGQTDRAATEIRQVWISADFTAFDEKPILQRYGHYLRPADDVARLDRLVWGGKEEAAHRMLPRVDPGHRAEALARLALANQSKSAEKLISKVPKDLLRDPGFLFERMRWYRRKEKYDEAIAILEHAPKDVSRPQLWWAERELLARHALQDGKISDAYRLASGHGMTEGPNFADAEFLAGWIALRYMHDPAHAKDHFTKLYNDVSRPISLARGAYWSGRAAQELGDKQLAAGWYAKAAQYLTTYYGQLAAAQIGTDGKAAVLEDPKPSPLEATDFEQKELVRVVRGLGEADAADFAKPFVLKLSDLAKTPGEHALVAALAIDVSRPDLAVAVARRASYAGVTLLTLGYPLAQMPPGGSVEGSLVLAMARQESGLDQNAVSPVGARGMLQLMPATAKRIAKDLQIPFSQQRLLTDPQYNLTLGRAYLEDMLDRFGGSYVLAVAAYNAGPARVSEWEQDMGDPRAKNTDVIDWVEAIPFRETRTYVQRVLENLQVYRLRMGDRNLAFSLALDLKR